MTVWRVLTAGLWATLAAAVAAGCSGDQSADGSDCPAGTYGCLCYPIGRCNPGLTCTSGRCVLPAAGVDAGVGGSGGAPVAVCAPGALEPCSGPNGCTGVR
jgi:hypothetical protein